MRFSSPWTCVTRRNRKASRKDLRNRKSYVRKSRPFHYPPGRLNPHSLEEEPSRPTVCGGLVRDHPSSSVQYLDLPGCLSLRIFAGSLVEIIHRRKSCASMIWLRKDTSDRVAWINPRNAAVMPRLSFSSLLLLVAHGVCSTCLLGLSVTRHSRL